MTTAPQTPVVALTQILFMIAAVSLVRERERGTFEQLLSTPLSLTEIMVGKMLPYVGVGYLGLCIMLSGSYLCFDIVPYRGACCCCLPLLWCLCWRRSRLEFSALRGQTTNSRPFF